MEYVILGAVVCPLRVPRHAARRAAWGLDFLFAGSLRHLGRLAPALAVSAVYDRYQPLHRQGRGGELPRHPLEALFG